MQVQYVVDFAVRSKSDPTSACAHAALLGHVQQWLEFAHDGVPDLTTINTDGVCGLERRDLGAEMSSRSGHGPRQLSWHRVGTRKAAAQRIDLRVPVRGVPATHVTGVTLGWDQAHEHATVRVVTGRESHGGWIAPTPHSFLRRPAVVRRIVEDADLVLSAYGRRVDGRPATITSPQEAAVLVEALRRIDRLPVLLLAPSHVSHLELADALAAELPGLANVVCLRTAGARDAVARAVGLEIAFGGARLVWPHLQELTHPRYETLDTELVGEVLRTIAPLSVVSRGIDVPYRRAERAGRAVVALELQQQVDAAAATGDPTEEITALRRQLELARDEVLQWVDEAHRLEDEVGSLTIALGQAGRRRTDVGNFGVPVDWHDAPALAADDAGPLLDFLEDRSGGRLRFTAGVDRTWRKSGYLHPALMRQALLTLGQASVEFAQSQGQITARLTDWFRERFGLDVATTDQALLHSGLASFEFDGQKLNGVPHVKLGDAKRSNECGRIYFAHQSDPPRFVVHHVGLHVL